MAKRGAKSKYNAKIHKDIICNLVRENKTMEEIAKIIEVDIATLYRWQANNTELCESIKKARENLLDKVEKNLYERAFGFTYKEKKKIVEGKQDKSGKVTEGARVKIEEVEKYLPPEVAACCFILKTQRPDKYKEQQDINITQAPIIVDDIPEE